MTSPADQPRHRPLSDWANHLESALRDAATPRQVLVYRRTASTQNLARARAAQRVAILADEQTAGRGRFGRHWLAPPNTALLLSLTHPIDQPRRESADRVTFVTAVAVAESLERWLPDLNLEIKWPNDIMARGRKVAGILVETTSLPSGQRVAIVGVGVNVGLTRHHLQQFPPAIADQITSLALLGAHADRLDVAATLIPHIDALLAATDDTPQLSAWRRRNLMSEQHITLSSRGQTITGTVVDLDPHDGLILRRDTGEIIHLPAATTTVR